MIHNEFSDLVQAYGQPNKIPDRTLYDYVVREDVWDSLCNREAVSFEQVRDSSLGQEVRRRMKQDLFFLACYALWGTNPEGAGRPIEFNKMNEATHRRVCDMYVKKDDSKSIADQDTCKERLILYPRGSFKSTIDVADTVQWILNFPEIRIMFLTAEKSLAVGFVDETKGHFIQKLYEPSWMNIFFPEFCVSEDEMQKENMYEFTCPVWKARQVKRKEPTVLALSIESSISGRHFDVIKPDDMVSNNNSESEEQCKKVIKNFYINKKTLMSYGYLEFNGTRYADADLYGRLIENNVGEVVSERGPCWELITNKTTGFKILIGRAWEFTPEAKLKLDEGTLTREELKAEHYNLLFPENLSFSFLRKEQAADETSFESQYCNNPRPLAKVLFERPLLAKHTVPFNEIPYRGPCSQTWDFAFSTKKGRDYTTGCNVMWNEKGSFYVTELVRARYKHTDLAKAVVDMAVKYRPFVVGIEDAAGSKFLEPTIIDYARKTGIPEVIAVLTNIDWIKPDNQKEAKQQRMAALHPWLVNDRMWFANYLPQIEVIYEEFERCLLDHHHDDIPDVISQQPRYAPRTRLLIEEKGLDTRSMADVAWHMLYEEGWSGPTAGYLLTHDPVTGELKWNAPIPYPLVPVEPVEPEVKAEAPPGLDPILGGGLYG